MLVQNVGHEDNLNSWPLSPPLRMYQWSLRPMRHAHMRLTSQGWEGRKVCHPRGLTTWDAYSLFGREIQNVFCPPVHCGMPVAGVETRSRQASDRVTQVRMFPTHGNQFLIIDPPVVSIILCPLNVYITRFCKWHSQDYLSGGFGWRWH